MVQFYRINHVTVARGINLLVDQGILYKKRGIGVFVAPGAREALLEARRGRSSTGRFSPTGSGIPGSW
ncbi:hypothetical protein [Alkalispirochaeta alkalica]|uniref:hypothetical protein n=1 Tax=Alkalispirochaeta alkalica TaxID=46356 RepID=UPI00035C6E0C|nr:hypothetical protein [Alkalispirochaeta alkalica]